MSRRWHALLRFAIVSISSAVMLREAIADETHPERPILAEQREHWAYKPLADVKLPQATSERLGTHEIDRLLAAAMAKRGVEPLPRAGKASLLRRVTFDLTGLSPTPDDVLAFASDPSPAAYEKVIDRLLASPEYGVRWAQHWLDLARFSETDGFEHDLVRPNAWRYRDWVVDALNADMPFDEFLSLQLAGDELRPGDPQAAVATGFLLCGPDMPDLNLQDERRHLVLNEMTSTVGAVFLGQQVGCAQCHDHKFDAISQHDFYRLRAFFESAELFRDHEIPTPAELAARQAAEAARGPETREQMRRREELEALGRQRFAAKNPDVYPSQKQILAELSKDERQEHKTIAEALKTVPKPPGVSQGRVMRDTRPAVSHYYVRGDFRQRGEQLTPGFLRVVSDADAAVAATNINARTLLAQWLTNPSNPLVPRVIANRLWQWHFGVGLAASSSDFGVMGSEPTNGELLDWLARRLIEERWSLKKMHRLLVTSEAYQTASAAWDESWSPEHIATAAAIWKSSTAVDPNNELLWRRNRRRLDGEVLRDTMLAASGSLSSRRGGPGIRAPLPEEISTTLLKDQWKPSGDEEDHRRRSLYLFVRRNLRWPLFDVFDRPDTNASCAARHESTTATQSLMLLNSEFSLQCARRLAGVVLREQPSDTDKQIDAVYVRVLARHSLPDERQVAKAFLETQLRQLAAAGQKVDSLSLPLGLSTNEADALAQAALVSYCLAMLNVNEFVYVD